MEIDATKAMASLDLNDSTTQATACILELKEDTTTTAVPEKRSADHRPCIDESSLTPKIFKLSDFCPPIPRHLSPPLPRDTTIPLIGSSVKLHGTHRRTSSSFSLPQPRMDFRLRSRNLLDLVLGKEEDQPGLCGVSCGEGMKTETVLALRDVPGSPGTAN